MKKGGERREEGCEVADVLVVVVEALDGVPHQGVVGDRGVDVGEGVGDRFLLEAVGGDALVPLLYVAELLAEVARVRLLVVAEEGGDAAKDGEGRASRGHDHVGDVGHDGAVQPA